MPAVAGVEGRNRHEFAPVSPLFARARRVLHCNGKRRSIPCLAGSQRHESETRREIWIRQMKTALNRMDRPQTLPLRKNIAPGPFSGLCGRALERYRSMGTNVNYPQGCRLFAEKDPAHSVFVLESGSVKMTTVSTEGRALILKIAGRGDILGLGSVLRRNQPGNSQYDFSAEALHPSIARVVRAQEFMNFLREFPSAGEAVTRTLLRDYHCTLRALRRFVFPATVAGRIADFLLEWCDGRRTGPVMFPMTHIGKQGRHLRRRHPHDDEIQG